MTEDTQQPVSLSRRRVAYIAKHAPGLIAKLMTYGGQRPQEAARNATEALAAVFDNNNLKE